MTIKAIIFDYYGVIRPDNFTKAYEHFGGDPVKDSDFIRETIDATSRGLIPSSQPAVAERLGISVEDWAAAVRGRRGNDQRLLAYIKSLRKQYKTGLLTNLSKGRLPELFDAEPWTEFFDAAVASGDAGFAKPDSEAYEAIANRLNVRPDECIFIDDRADYCDGAQAVGMQPIQYHMFTQCKRALEALLRQAA